MPTRREANCPLGLASTATRSRSILVTKPCASNSSRSSRASSSGRNGTPRQRPAQHRRHRHRRYHRHRHDHREQVWLSDAHRQPDRRDDDFGRAARVHAAAERQRFRQVRPPSRAAEKRAAELAEAGDHDQRQRQQQQIVGRRARRDWPCSPATPKNTGMNSADDQAAQLLVDVPGQDRRLADQDAGDKGAEHGMHADRVGDQRHDPHDDQDRGDDRQVADEIVVGPADQQEDQRGGRS